MIRLVRLDIPLAEFLLLKWRDELLVYLEDGPVGGGWLMGCLKRVLSPAAWEDDGFGERMEKIIVNFEEMSG
jgi:hypothetical protein